MIPQDWKQLALTPPALKNGKEWHVFLSYRSVNRRWVLNLYDVLTEFGFKVFMDQYVLQPGDELITELQNALDKSQAGILIWSCSTSDSKWVSKEFQTLERKATTDNDFRFIPIKIENCKLPEFASNRIFIDFTEYPEGPNGGDLIRLIYSISGQKLKGDAIHFADQQDSIYKEIYATVKAAIQNGDADRIIALYDQGGLPWQTSAALGCTAIDGLIKLKKYAESITLCDRLIAKYDVSLRPKQLKALSLARRGENDDLAKAQEILGKLYVSNHLDPETLGIYGRTWMDKYNSTGDKIYLKNSIRYYAEAFEKSPDDYYTGINAASKSIFLDTEEGIQKGMEYAKKVAAIVGMDPADNDYWKTATVAETLLIQKKYIESAVMYKAAVEMAILERGSHESTYDQAKKLMEKLKPTPEERNYIDKAFEHL